MNGTDGRRSDYVTADDERTRNEKIKRTERKEKKGNKKERLCVCNFCIHSASCALYDEANVGRLFHSEPRKCNSHKHTHTYSVWWEHCPNRKQWLVFFSLFFYKNDNYALCGAHAQWSWPKTAMPSHSLMHTYSKIIWLSRIVATRWVILCVHAVWADCEHYPIVVLLHSSPCPFKWFIPPAVKISVHFFSDLLCCAHITPCMCERVCGVRW